MWRWMSAGTLANIQMWGRRYGPARSNQLQSISTRSVRERAGARAQLKRAMRRNGRRPCGKHDHVARFSVIDGLKRLWRSILVDYSAPMSIRPLVLHRTMEADNPLHRSEFPHDGSRPPI